MSFVEDALTRELVANYPSYIEVLANNPDRYILCMPPNPIVVEKCEIDNKFIQEHILEMLSDTEYRSLAGRNFKAFDHELHLIDAGDGPKLFCSILNSDMFYLDQKCYKRYSMSNTLDSRFYVPIVNKFNPGADSV